jgi:hypothetical protein
MWPNFLTLIVGKYLNIFVKESKKSSTKQLSYLHYENLQIIRIVASQFFFDLDFSFRAANWLKKSPWRSHYKSLWLEMITVRKPKL